MSLFSYPVIFLPGDGECDCRRRPRVARIARRDLRRRPYSRQVSRHPLDYLFDVADPFDHLYLDCHDPEEKIHDMFDLPARYSIGQPRRVYVYETRQKPNDQKTEDTNNNNNNRQEPKSRNARHSANDKPAKRKPGDALLLDLDQLVNHLFKNLYRVNSGSRCQMKTGTDVSKKVEDPEGKNKEISSKKPSSTERTANGQREPVKEGGTENDNRQQQINMKNVENEGKTKIDTTSNVENVIRNKETTESDDVRVVFVVDDNASEEDKDESAADVTLMDTQEEHTQEDGSEKKTDMDSSLQQAVSNDAAEAGETETTNEEKDHEPMDIPDSEKKRAGEVEESEKFQVTFDLSSFLPEEIQVKLSDERLILDAVHHEVNEGSVEKQSLQKVILLPPGVETDSLRCRLSDDGHMTISANYIGKSKESKILTIEKETD